MKNRNHSKSCSGRRLPKVHHTIDIEIVLNRISFRTGETKDGLPVMVPFEQMTREQHEAYDAYLNFIRTFMSAVLHKGFCIVEQSRSEADYSRCIQCVPGDCEGPPPAYVLDVKFRLSGPPEENRTETADDGETRVPLFLAFVVDGAEQEGVISALKTVMGICDKLQTGEPAAETDKNGG